MNLIKKIKINKAQFTDKMKSKDNSPDLSLSSQELNSFDREKLLELAYEKDMIKEDSFNFIAFNELMSYEESEEVEKKILRRIKMITKRKKNKTKNEEKRHLLYFS